MIMEGKDKGQTGTVMRVYKKKNRLLVEGRNLFKKDTTPTESMAGGIITKEAPIHVSNVMVRSRLLRQRDCRPAPAGNSPENRVVVPDTSA